MSNRYSAEQLQFLKSGYAEMPIADLTVAFNARFGLGKTPEQIKATLNNHKFRCGRKKGQFSKGVLRSFTVAQGDYLRAMYRELSIPDLTAAFNARFGLEKTPGQIRAFTRNHGVKSGRTGQFDKGQQPWNTGTQGLVKPNSGNFKKGGTPPNRKALWTERISKDGYIEIKIPQPDPYSGAPTRYRLKHLWLWEQAHGPVPEGQNLRYKDGDRRNCCLDNLELISRAENALLNTMDYNAMPAELKPTVKAMAKLHVRALEMERER